VRAAGAVCPSASYGFLTECDFPTPAGGSALKFLPFSGDQEAAGEDHEAPEVVLIEASDLTDQIAIKWHLGYERTQDRPKLQVAQAGDASSPRASDVGSAGTRRASRRFHPKGAVRRPVCASHRSRRLGSRSRRRSATRSSRASYRMPMVATAGSRQPIFAHDRMVQSVDYIHVIRKHACLR
jgi:hypothetical protein